MKVYISPSDQTANAYAAGNTYEAMQCREIAKLLVKALTRCGIDARTNVVASMASRVAEGNAWGADLYVCLHTNAFNGKVSGTRIFVSALTAKSYRAAKKIFDALAPITPGKSENISARPELFEIKFTDAPCVYIEVDFHDVPDVAIWIIEHKPEIAEAICKGICNYAGIPYKPEETKPAEPTNNKITVSVTVNGQTYTHSFNG